MEKYQSVTSYQNGAINITVDKEGAIVTKLAGDHPLQTVVMSRGQAQELLTLLAEGLAKTKEHQLWWHETFMATYALEDGRRLYGSERLELQHEGTWIHGRAGHLVLGGGLVFFPDGSKKKEDYINLTIGSIVRDVSQPYGDGNPNFIK